MKKILIIPNMQRDKDGFGTRKVISLLKSKNYLPIMDNSLKKNNFDAEYTDITKCPDIKMAIIIGGDGTILANSKRFINTDVPIIGINHGHVGFLTELEKDDIKYLEQILDENYIIDERPVLSIEYNREKYFSINEATIHRGNSAKMLNIEIIIDNITMNSFRADGLIVSTSSGSTAYSLSAGGPIIDPMVNAFVITPICPHNLYIRSVVVPAEREIIVKLKNTESGVFSVDGNMISQLDGNQEITITKGGFLKMIKLDKNSFYNKVKKKFFEKDV
ncbi:MAG: NAD(+)/NADH kinase [Clostridia bacterium]|nr:NAD(+)/NADH kinase [Clostridia bacterium]